MFTIYICFTSLGKGLVRRQQCTQQSTEANTMGNVCRTLPLKRKVVTADTYYIKTSTACPIYNFYDFKFYLTLCTELSNTLPS